MISKFQLMQALFATELTFTKIGDNEYIIRSIERDGGANKFKVRGWDRFYHEVNLCVVTTD